MRLFDPTKAFQFEIPVHNDAHRIQVIQTRLNRVLAFTRLSIHDVVNSRIAKNQVLGYWKLSRQIDRSMEITELERQWNPNG
jgi:hypothetical protein